MFRKVTGKLAALHNVDTNALPLTNTKGEPRSFDIGKTVWSRIEHAAKQIPEEVADPDKNEMYDQSSYIIGTLLGNTFVDLLDVVGASPVGAAQTTSSFSTARRDQKHLSLGIWGFGASNTKDCTVQEIPYTIRSFWFRFVVFGSYNKSQWMSVIHLTLFFRNATACFFFRCLHINGKNYN